MHSTRSVPAAAYFYYTIKGGVTTRFILQESYFFHTFRNIFPGVKPKAFFYFTYILHCILSGAGCPRLPGQFFHGLPHRVGRKQEHTTAGVYLHMTAHITQLKILHGVSLLCVCFVPGASPVNTVSHNSDTIKRTSKRFCGFFAQKAAYAPFPPRRSGLCRFPTAPRFRRKQAPELPFSVTTPSRENGIAERPQTLRYPEIKNNFSSDYAQSARGGHSKSSRCASIILPHPSHGRGSLSAHSAPHTGRCRRRCR